MAECVRRGNIGRAIVSMRERRACSRIRDSSTSSALTRTSSSRSRTPGYRIPRLKTPPSSSSTTSQYDLPGWGGGGGFISMRRGWCSLWSRVKEGSFVRTKNIWLLEFFEQQRLEDVEIEIENCMKPKESRDNPSQGFVNRKEGCFRRSCQEQEWGPGRLER